MIEWMVKERNIKKMSQLQVALVKSMTKGNTFKWNGESDEMAKIDEANRESEIKAIEMIKANLEIIPNRIKRDIEL